MGELYPPTAADYAYAAAQDAKKQATAARYPPVRGEWLDDFWAREAWPDWWILDYLSPGDIGRVLVLVDTIKRGHHLERAVAECALSEYQRAAEERRKAQ